jgi:hypothetical protein
MDFNQLVSNKTVPGSICNWINRDTTPATEILTEAQAHIYTRLRHWRMKTELEDAMVYGQEFVTIPVNFIDVREFRIVGPYANRIRRGDERSVQSRYNYDASGSRVLEAPGWYYIAAEGLMLDTVPDQEYPFLLTYFGAPEDLSEDNTTNWLTRFYPRLLRSACMLLACEYEKEAGQGNLDRTYWEQIFEAERQEVQAKSDIVERASDAEIEFA